MTQRDRLSKRNEAVRAAFDALQRRHPQWRLDAIIDKLSERYFVSPRTIEAIIKREVGYDY